MGQSQSDHLQVGFEQKKNIEQILHIDYNVSHAQSPTLRIEISMSNRGEWFIGELIDKGITRWNSFRLGTIVHRTFTIYE